LELLAACDQVSGAATLTRHALYYMKGKPCKSLDAAPSRS
jgi:hypothetical protein